MLADEDIEGVCKSDTVFCGRFVQQEKHLLVQASLLLLSETAQALHEGIGNVPERQGSHDGRRIAM